MEQIQRDVLRALIKFASSPQGFTAFGRQMSWMLNGVAGTGNAPLSENGKKVVKLLGEAALEEM